MYVCINSLQTAYKQLTNTSIPTMKELQHPDKQRNQNNNTDLEHVHKSLVPFLFLSLGHGYRKMPWAGCVGLVGGLGGWLDRLGLAVLAGWPGLAGWLAGLARLGWLGWSGLVGWLAACLAGWPEN